MTLTIRPFRFPHDLPTLISITVAAFQFSGRPEWSVPDNLAQIVQPQVRAFRAVLPLWRLVTMGAPTQRTALGGFVAQVNGDPVGVANVIRLRQSPHFEIGNVGVHPDFRRRGIARQLMEACLQDAAHKGGRSAYLDVIADNVGAVTLYEKMGFQHIDRSLEMTHAGPTPIPHADRLPAAYRAAPFGFGDGYYWAHVDSSSGRPAPVGDFQYLWSIRRLAPVYFALAEMGFWGRAIVDATGTVQAVASLLFQRGTTMGTLSIADEAVLSGVLSWMVDTAARRAPNAALTLSIRQSPLPHPLLMQIAESVGFWTDFTHARMALSLPYGRNRVQSEESFARYKNEVS